MKHVLITCFAVSLAGCSAQKRQAEIARAETQRLTAELADAKNAKGKAESAAAASAAQFLASQQKVAQLEAAQTSRDERLRALEESDTKLKERLSSFLLAMATKDADGARFHLDYLTEMVPGAKSAIAASSDSGKEERRGPRVLQHDARFKGADLDVWVPSARWQNSIGVGSSDSYQPWLVVSLSISNNGNRPLQLPKLQLVDSSGSVYDIDSSSFLMPRGLRPLQQINPNTFEIVSAAFKAPRGLDYKLGFMWDGVAHLISFQTPK